MTSHSVYGPAVWPILTIFIATCIPATSFIVSRPSLPSTTFLGAEESCSFSSSEHETTSANGGIISIESHNLAGTKSSCNLEFGQLTAVTGETGSGKSVLVARALELLMRGGGKLSGAGSTLVDDQTWVKLDLLLSDDHWKSVQASEQKFGVLSDRRVTLQRSFRRTNGRLTSTCTINGETVALKALTSFCSPLLAVVDAASAAAALVQPEGRLAIIDRGVETTLRKEFSDCRHEYLKVRRKREKLEQELANRVLPASFGEEDLEEALDHWIEELSEFEQRASSFTKRMYDLDDPSSTLFSVARTLAKSSWKAVTDDDNAIPMYEALAGFRSALVTMDQQLQATRNAATILSALSVQESAVTAVEQCRNHLIEATTQSQSRDTAGKFEQGAEHAHELLNSAEAALEACARFIEEADNGPLKILESTRMRCPVQLEDVESLLLDWNDLARKHGIVPEDLGTCHRTLCIEKDGNNEAQELLPRLLEEEEGTLQRLRDVSKRLSLARREVAVNVASTVTSRLPSLGMERCCLQIEVSEKASPEDNDGIAFSLKQESEDHSSGGPVHEAASSGEKARILLAIECALPGAVGVSCKGSSEESESGWYDLPPIAVVYDEIDAHVGGRAAVAMSTMLVNQSRRSQVVAITHSPSVAAAAESHIVVQRSRADGETGSPKSVMEARTVEDKSRRKELARMASGDMATEEAEKFAEALIRESRLNAVEV